MGRPEASSEYRIDCGLLVLGLIVWKSGAQLVVCSGLKGKTWRFAQLPLRCDLDQLARDLPDPVLHARFARLPSAAAKTVEIDLRLLRAISREELDVLYGQEQLVTARIMKLQTIMRRPGSFGGAQLDKPAYAMIDVHDEIAGGEARRLGDEILRPARASARAYQAVAQDILLADDCDLGRLKPVFEPEHRQRDLRDG